LITRITFREKYRSLSSSLYNILQSPVTSSLLRPQKWLSWFYAILLWFDFLMIVRCRSIHVGIQIKPTRCNVTQWYLLI
jgi:hypothetical protein